MKRFAALTAACVAAAALAVGLAGSAEAHDNCTRPPVDFDCPTTTTSTLPAVTLPPPVTTTTQPAQPPAPPAPVPARPTFTG